MPTFKEHFTEAGLTVSNESLMSGNIEREIEFCMYVELEDIAELKKKAVSVERHEQWLLPIEKPRVDGKARIRLINDQRATMCTKIKREGMIGCEEVETDIPMDMFTHLRQMAKDGYIKNRYAIPSNIQGLIWEVDVFYSNGGQPHPWVKVDLEVKSMNDPIPKFPLSHRRVIYADTDLSFSEKQRVRDLWEREWQKIDFNLPE